MGIGQKVKDVAHKMGVGHTGEEEPGASDLGASYRNVGATYGAEGTSGIAARVAPGTATTASDVAARPMGEAGYGTTTGQETAGYGTAGQETAGYGTAADQETAGYGTAAGQETAGYTRQATTTGQGATCAAETFTRVEDRPVVKERVELVRVHIPVEKEFVVETRATGGEREVGGGQVESLGTTERVVAAQGPKGPCE